MMIKLRGNNSISRIGNSAIVSIGNTWFPETTLIDLLNRFLTVCCGKWIVGRNLGNPFSLCIQVDVDLENLLIYF